MATRRVMHGVLHNFLTSYTSRYSDFRGYWLFGFLVADLQIDREFSLIAPPERREDEAWRFAMTLASERFKDQVAKAGLSLAVVPAARLLIHRVPLLVSGFAGGWAALGYNIEFGATALMDTGKSYQARTTIFVAPHNPAFESRRARDKWLGDNV